MGENLQEPGLGRESLGLTPDAQSIKEKIEKLDLQRNSKKASSPVRTRSKDTMGCFTEEDSQTTNTWKNAQYH